MIGILCRPQDALHTESHVRGRVQGSSSRARGTEVSEDLLAKELVTRSGNGRGPVCDKDLGNITGRRTPLKQDTETPRAAWGWRKLYPRTWKHSQVSGISLVFD